MVGYKRPERARARTQVLLPPQVPDFGLSADPEFPQVEFEFVVLLLDGFRLVLIPQHEIGIQLEKSQRIRTVAEFFVPHLPVGNDPFDGGGDQRILVHGDHFGIGQQPEREVVYRPHVATDQQRGGEDGPQRNMGILFVGGQLGFVGIGTPAVSQPADHQHIGVVVPARGRGLRANVLRHEVIADDIRLLTALWPDREHAPHAGQFFTLRAWGADEAPFLSRPISVHKWDAETQTVEFLYAVVGEGTRKLTTLKKGDSFQLTGPMGNGFDVADILSKYQKIAVVGGGIGTAPMYQLTRELAAGGVKPDVFFGFRDKPYCMEEYRSIAGIVKVSTDTGAVGFHGFVTQLYDPADYDVVLVCGPTVMMRNAARLCAEKGTPCFVSLEKKMACGIGACLGCTCETRSGEGKSVCKNGPVFDAAEVF